MSVTAFMHKSIKSKLSLFKRSAITKYAIDGYNKPCTTNVRFLPHWVERTGRCAKGGFVSACMAPIMGIGSLFGWAKNGTNEESQDEITFYWRGDGLWCALPWESYMHDVQNKGFHKAKVEGIDGNFENQEIIIRFTKTRGNSTAIDRVIDLSKGYTNLKETLVWIRDNGREYLDESVIENLDNETLRFTPNKQCEECKGSKKVYVPGYLWGSKKQCPKCGGTGEAPRSRWAKVMEM